MDRNWPERDLEILFESSEQPTITLRGEVDCRSALRLRRTVMKLVEQCKMPVRVDISGLIFRDTAGVSAVMDVARVLSPEGGILHLIDSLRGLGGEINLSKRAGSSRNRSGVSDRCAEDQVVVEFEVPGVPEMVSEIRSRAVCAAREMPFSREQIEDIELAVGEAGSNAVRHGCGTDGATIKVRIERCRGCLRVFVADPGPGFDPEAVEPAPPDLFYDGGRGIMLMRALMDEVIFHFDSPGTRVELVKRVDTPDGSSDY